MNLTDLQLECQKLGGDKTKKRGCIVVAEIKKYNPATKKEMDLGRHIKQMGDWEIEGQEMIENIGHPITRGRLYYLHRTIERHSFREFDIMLNHFNSKYELYQQTILEWDEKTQIKVRDFLLSLQ